MEIGNVESDEDRKATYYKENVSTNVIFITVELLKTVEKVLRIACETLDPTTEKPT